MNQMLKMSKSEKNVIDFHAIKNIVHFTQTQISFIQTNRHTKLNISRFKLATRLDPEWKYQKQLM